MNKLFSKNIDERAQRWILIGIVIAVFLVILGISLRIYEYIQLRHDTEHQAAITVEVLKAKQGSLNEKIILPANVVAWHEATIYARTNGYVSKWFVDIGAHVKQGKLLAIISAPEVDAQLRQTEADLKTAEANYKLAQITAIRWKNLLKTDSVSQQETDDKVSDAVAKAAIVAATRATRDRLKDLVRFQRVVAPFDGIISSRTTDIGRLINAGSSGTVPLFKIVQSNRLRIYTQIPQYYSVNITHGLTAQLRFREHPAKAYQANLLDSAKAINPQTRTLLVQFWIDNTNYELMPGSYSEVEFVLPSHITNIRLPISTLIFRAQGTQVAIVDKLNQAMLKPITINLDFGDYIEVSTGIKPGDRIILNPPDSIFDGEKVRIVSPKSQRQTQGKLS